MNYYQNYVFSKGQKGLNFLLAFQALHRLLYFKTNKKTFDANGNAGEKTR